MLTGFEIQEPQAAHRVASRKPISAALVNRSISARVSASRGSFQSCRHGAVNSLAALASWSAPDFVPGLISLGGIVVAASPPTGLCRFQREPFEVRLTGVRGALRAFSRGQCA